MDLFETKEEYFAKVIGRLPDELCPEPHRALRDYVKYEVTQDADKPPRYVTLAERQSSWPEDQRDGPQPWNIRLLEHFPFTDGVYSWWPIIQAIPRKGCHV